MMVDVQVSQKQQDCESLCCDAARKVQIRLDDYWQCSAWGSELIEWARYSVVGGKALRPALLLWSHRQLGDVNEESADILDMALAVELVHAFSLIQDDLPCMDNDDYRRGKATLHKYVGEANALLCSDALLAASFQILARLQSASRAKIIDFFVDCVGGTGLIEGQRRDLLSGDESTLEDINLTYQLKTAKLFSFCLAAPALIKEDCELNNSLFLALKQWGEDLGIYFQITDDLLDCRQSSGKDVGSDIKNNKKTYSHLDQELLQQKMQDLSAQIKQRSQEIFNHDRISCWLNYMTDRQR